MSGIRINTNAPALNAQRRLADATAAVARSYERLSSGMRINRASDDPAGLAIASSLRTDSRVFSQAMRNVNDGLSLLNVAQGALSELSNITIRQRELAAQAANGAYTLQQRRALNAEANALVDEFNRIVASTEFNGRKLFEAGNGDISLQVGLGADGGLAISLGDELARTVGLGTFGGAGSFSAAASVGGFAASDINHDGNADLISAGYNTGGAYVSFGNGDGTFAAARSYYLKKSDGNSVLVSDFNGDGNRDFVVATYGLGGGVSVFLGNSNGTFAAAARYEAEEGSWYFEMGDFNSDGRTDLAVPNQFDGTISMLLGNSDGTFSAPRQTPATDVASTAAADFNGDGKLDLVIADGSTNVSLRLGNGDGNFAAPVSFSLGIGFSFTVDAGDVNNDGLADFVVSNANDGFGYKAEIFLGRGDGTFTMSASYELGNVGSLQLADLNNDGRLDLQSAGFATNANMYTLLGNGNGTFRITDTVAGDAALTKVIGAADLNNDGVLDQLYSDPTSNRMMVRLANTEESCNTPYLNLNTAADARAAMSVIDTTLERIGRELGNIGSSQSRLSYALNNLATQRENYEAAASGITDVDVAMETAQLVRSQILQLAAAAVLAQANQQPALALQLLQR